MKINCVKPGIWLVDNLLSIQECEDLIAIVEKGPFPKSRYFGNGGNNFEICTKNQDLIIRLFDRLNRLEFEDASNFIKIKKIFSLISFQKYEIGNFVIPHFDTPIESDLKELSELTLLIYLNHDFEGGETIFHSEEIKVLPLTGSALIFKQLREMIHEGSIVKKGVKYIFRANCI